MGTYQREFVEVIRLDEFTRIVRVGYWWHITDPETGEGRWEWHGPQERLQFGRAFQYAQRENFPQF